MPKQLTTALSPLTPRLPQRLAHRLYQESYGLYRCLLLLMGFRIELQYLDLALLLQELGRELLMLYPSHRFTVHSAPQAIWVLANTLHLKQACYHLLQNGVKYSLNQAVIDIEVGWQTDEAWLRITDRGIGIVREDLAHIFRCFYRGRQTCGRKVPGLGVGLYVVQRIVAMHNGRIRVHSQPGQGTQFTLYLPLK